jgi:DnaJ family protein A protein 2
MAQFFFGGGGNPFGGGGFGGGFPGGPGMEEDEKEVDNTEFYELLGVEKTATAPQIKKAFRSLARKHHPDKGGDPELVRTVPSALKICNVFAVQKDQCCS